MLVMRSIFAVQHYPFQTRKRGYLRTMPTRPIQKLGTRPDWCQTVTSDPIFVRKVCGERWRTCGRYLLPGSKAAPQSQVSTFDGRVDRPPFL
jgi:hypothetical protein